VLRGTYDAQTVELQCAPDDRRPAPGGGGEVRLVSAP